MYVDTLYELGDLEINSMAGSFANEVLLALGFYGLVNAASIQARPLRSSRNLS